MNTRPIALTAIAATLILAPAVTQADENVFVRGKDKFLEVTEGPKDVVKGVGKDIGFGFRDAWRRVSSFVTGKQPEPEFPTYPTYNPGAYTPPPYGYSSPQGTNYAPGYGPSIPVQRQAAPRQYPNPYTAPAPPLRPQASTPRQLPPPVQQPRTPALTRPQTTPPVTKPAPPVSKPKPQPKVEAPKKTAPPVEPPKQTEPQPTPPQPAPDDDGLPEFAVPIPGKNGMVYSPFTKDKKPVDVRDIPSGTVVKDPYTNKLFRVP